MGETGAVPVDLSAAADFLTERHLATLTTYRADGSAHVVPVGFTWDAVAGLARVITSGTSQKAANVRRDGRAVLCQVDGRRWLTLEGTARVAADPAAVAEAVERYARRYRQPRENPARVAIEISVTRALGSAS
ncbi:MAG TPA: TIGR03618 family F420-dependent PPOX class oxidoreductase [Mycobacteriales bacterium]|nr:TIGR03618 family F420-dependent PPOX class oxidoreductase [Mycobacteriales bacterium]